MCRYRLIRAFSIMVVDQTNMTATTYSLNGLAAGTRYVWRVCATNPGGTSTYSPVWNFTTAAPPPPPPAPILATPANGTTGAPTSLTLAWNASAGATSYHVQ